MTPLLTVAELEARLPANTLPTTEGGSLDEPRILAALQTATGIIATHLPWLLDDGTDEVAIPLPAQFEDALLGVCADIAFSRLSDRVSSSEDDRERYKANLTLLETISREHQGGLVGPDYQEAGLAEPDEDEGIPDVRFFKKGEMC